MDEIKITIDGKEIVTTKGRTILDAALENGIDIPYFCYHPKLKPYGACRVCLVEIEKWPKLQVSCATVASDGMVIYTRNERVTKARQAVIEFILLNHPLDCPTCDKGGECPLQNITYQYGLDYARTVEPRQRFIVDENSTFDDLPIGPEIVRNQNRCIHCYRCVRIVDEVFDEDDLGAHERGHSTEILPPPGREIRNLYSGNVVENCPVGALTNRDFRYKIRVWLTKQKKTICTQCPDGCNLTAWTSRDKIFRATSRRNDRVDDGFICDVGRYGYQYAHHPDRLESPMIKREGELEECTWEEAYNAIIDKLKTTKGKHGPQGIASLVGEDCSNEDYYVIGKFMRSVVGSNSIDHRLNRKKKLSHKDELVNLGIIGTDLTYDGLEKADLFVVVGSDLHSENPITAARLLKARHENGAKIVMINPAPSRLSRAAEQYIHKHNTEIGILAAMVRTILSEKLHSTEGLGIGDADVEKFLSETSSFSIESVSSDSGISVDDLKALAKRIAEAKQAIFITGQHVDLHYQRDMILTALYNLALVSGNLRDNPKSILIQRMGSNNRGCYLFGMRPDRLPICKPYSDKDSLASVWEADIPDREGADTIDILRQIEESKVELAFAVGTDPVTTYPDREYICSTVSKLDFLVVADLFLTETAKLADVVLPMSSHFESSGSVSNWEGRIQTFERVMKPLKRSRPAWMMFSDLAAKLEIDFGYMRGKDVFNEFAPLISGDSSLGFRTMPEEGVCVPSPTPIDQSAGLQPLTFKTPDFDEKQTYVLLTGNGDHHIGRNRTTRSESLNRFQEEPYVGISAKTANELALSEDDLVRVENSAGKLIGPVKYIEDLRDDVVWIPDNFPKMPANTLKNRDVDIDRVSLVKV